MQKVSSITMLALWLAVSALAAESMPAAQQNALVQKYCAVCHTDAAKNGGLTLEHFDAAQAPASLTAMLLSKLSGGVSLEMVNSAGTDPGAATLLDGKMKSGAMGAAGIPIPDKTTIDGLVRALAVGSGGAAGWSVQHEASQTTASILREVPSAKISGTAEAYRLIASCDTGTKEGFLQLAWSPVPQSGTLNASVDGKTPTQFRVEGSEAMGNHSKVILHGRAAIALTGVPFPAESLTITDLFPGDTVTFPFASLPKDARREFSACFPLH